MKKSKESKKSAESNIAANNLNAFMKGMEDDDTRQIIVNLQAALEFKEEELRIYRKKYTEATGKERPDLTDDERRGLARKGKELNKLLLSLVDASWSPQTVLGWYKTLIADEYNSVAPGQKKRGRPAVTTEIEKRIIQIAKSNRNWGYQRVQMTMIYLGFEVSLSTVKRIMNKHVLFAPVDGRSASDFNLFFESHKNWRIRKMATPECSSRQTPRAKPSISRRPPPDMPCATRSQVCSVVPMATPLFSATGFSSRGCLRTRISASTREEKAS